MLTNPVMFRDENECTVAEHVDQPSRATAAPEKNETHWISTSSDLYQHVSFTGRSTGIGGGPRRCSAGITRGTVSALAGNGPGESPNRGSASLFVRIRL